MLSKVAEMGIVLLVLRIAVLGNATMPLVVLLLRTSFSGHEVLQTRPLASPGVAVLVLLTRIVLLMRRLAIRNTVAFSI
jgi:hypothetical protein